MKFYPCVQGTPEWLALRAGRVTASKFREATSILTRASGDKQKGDPTAASDACVARVVIERISGKPFGEEINVWQMRRGHELEPHARLAYERRSGNIAEEAGIVTTDDGVFSYSTDGMVNPFFENAGASILKCEGLIEVKCPVDPNKILSMWDTQDVSEYEHQMQGGMWITGAKWCDFIMYVPDLEPAGKDLFIKRIPRDEAFIENMESQLLLFNLRVEFAQKKLAMTGCPDSHLWPFPVTATA